VFLRAFYKTLKVQICVEQSSQAGSPAVYRKTIHREQFTTNTSQKNNSPQGRFTARQFTANNSPQGNSPQR
jgi:hypothetical protein